jgi:hypothetical protein
VLKVQNVALPGREDTSLFKMLKLLCVVAVLLCCGLVSGHHFHSPRCLPMFGKYPFDEQKVWTGTANCSPSSASFEV